MTNKAIAAILDHLCNEARNSVHATHGVMDLLRDMVADPSLRTSVAIGKASADQLLRSIDDVRALVAGAPPSPAVLEEFDLALCTGEIVEVLNLASGKRAKHMLLEVPAEPVPIVQDRKAVEQVLTRVLDSAFKLAQTCEVRVRLTPHRKGGRLVVAARDAALTQRLTRWLNARADQASLQEPEELPFEIAVMLAGKHLRALEGTAQVVEDAAGHSTITIDFPPRVQALARDAAEMRSETDIETLSVLVAEDCDDSFVLNELLLGNAQVRRAHNGQEALQMVQRQRFDVVLMDVHMPGMDGYTGIRGIRDWETQTGNARTPIVLLSSDDLETQRQKAAQCGCSGFLRKPLRRSDLTNLLDRLVQTRTPEA